MAFATSCRLSKFQSRHILKTARHVAGDKIFLSADKCRRIRFDINRPFPHQSPHAHVEELVNENGEGRVRSSQPMSHIGDYANSRP